MSVFDASQLMFNNPSFYNNVSTQSLRFDTTNGTVLSKTPSASNLKTWTWAAWVKRSKLGVERAIWSVGASSVDFALYFHTTDQLRIWTTSGTGVYYTSKLFRDVGSWYHIAITSNDVSPYIRLYINGVLDTQTPVYDNRTSTPGSGNLSVNTNAIHRIGAWYNGSLQYFDGYLADINHIDGTAVGDTGGILDEFIQIKNGVCIPKSYSGSYGTNGYRLEFKQTGTGTASASTIGADTSGNNNHYTSTNLSAHDCVPDSPENNFPTMNAVNTNTNLNLSEGSLKLIPANTSDYYRSMSTMAAPKTGKWYWEVRLFVASYVYIFGLYDVESPNNQRATTIAGDAFSGTSDYQVRTSNSLGIDISNAGTAFSNWLGTNISSGDIISFAYDADNNKLWFALNGTFQNTSGTANPATGDDPRFSSITSTEYYLGANMPNPASGGAMFNFGQDSSFAGAETAQGNADGNGIGDFYYSPPSGYLALCSANLPELTISPNADTQADDYFNTVLYTGDGNDNRTVTGVGFQPDWLWIKNRSNTHVHIIYDSSRGLSGGYITSVNTNAESGTNTTLVKSFDTDGFTLGTSGAVNGSTNSLVSWNWKANGGTTSSNSNGSITSAVQTNTTAGFSIVTYTGTGSAATIGHGLPQAPDWVIVKNRDATDNWAVGTIPGGNFANHLQLNVTDGQTSAAQVFGGVNPTSTVFSVGTNHKTNASGEKYIAYCFHSVEGYSRFGIYRGNGNVNGAFIFTAFSPAWVLIKSTSNSTNGWYIYDNKRLNFGTLVDGQLYANLNNAEDDGNRDLDFISNGFKPRLTDTNVNANNQTYIYMAFAEAPFKFANAR